VVSVALGAFVNEPAILKSVADMPELTKQTISKELTMGRIAGPFSVPPFPTLRVSPIGLVPKKNGDFRMIHNLSYPCNNSVNDFIDHEFCSVRYSSPIQHLRMLEFQLVLQFYHLLEVPPMICKPLEMFSVFRDNVKCLHHHQTKNHPNNAKYLDYRNEFLWKMRLPQDKIIELTNRLKICLDAKKVSLRDLQSLLSPHII
jgi:hypothetical protein